MKTSVVAFVVGLTLLLPLSTNSASQKQQQQQTNTKQQQSSTPYSTHTPRRERNLDHWDAATLAFYLGIDPKTGKAVEREEYPGHDTAILFYAQWCRNCHALAPTWDAIATHLQAGTKSSKLIMALFDCELNYEHMKLCTAANVDHYPTLMFVGAGPYHDTDVVTSTLLGKKRSAGPAGPSPLPHTVKFQGIWQYGDAVLDWIHVMQGLSQWHRWTSTGVMKHVRNGFLGFLFPSRKSSSTTTTSSLPVGIPTGINNVNAVTSSLNAPKDNDVDGSKQEQIALLEKKLTASTKQSKQYEQMATQGSLLLDTILFPPTTTTTHTNVTNNTTATTMDMFTILNETNAWNVSSKVAKSVQSSREQQIGIVQRTCTVELSLDYCSRLSTHVTNDYLDELVQLEENGTTTVEYPTFSEIETLLKDRVQDKEPYCAIFDMCLTNDFTPESCRPATCPFNESVACRYLLACSEDTLLTEYAVALGMIDEGDEFPPPMKKATTTTGTTLKKEESSQGGKKASSGWGI